MKKKYRIKEMTIQKKVILVVSIILLLGSISIIILNPFNNSKVYKIESRKEKYEIARKADKNIVGWIKVPGTRIDYPVQLGYDGTKENATESIWTSDTVEDGRTRQIISGHNILNISSKPLTTDSFLTRFEQLMGYVYKDFTEDHLYVQFVDYSGDESLYKIYSVRFYNEFEDNGESYKTKEERLKYIDDQQQKSLYKFDVEVDETDELITLDTCTRFFGADGQSHFKIDARKVRSDEKTTNYNVETTKNYVIIEE